MTSRVIGLHEPLFAGNELAYLKSCLDSGFVSSAGPLVSKFEQAVADAAGVPCGVATVNGTAALHIALLVAGVRPDDEVVVSTVTFVAPVNAISYCRAHPVLMDSDRESWNLDPQKTVDFLKNGCVRRDGALYNRRTGRRVAAVLPVHILGHPADLDPIVDAAHGHGLPVIEDVSESLGARYQGRPLGSLGDLACFSFNGSKVVTAGGGGMVVTRRRDWAERARFLTTQAKADPLEYVHHEVGYNYRLPNLNAALGLAQMEQLPAVLAAKRRIADTYRAACAAWPGVAAMPSAPWAESTFWLFTLRLADATLKERDRVLSHLNRAGIQARPLWVPMHRLSLYQHAERHQIEWADQLYETAVSLPSSPGLSAVDQQYVIDTLAEALSARPRETGGTTQ